MTKQEKEIQTIQKRTIAVNLSDADCERIAKKAGAAGLTVGELIENFIGDLICGTHTNGSDERMYAEQWFSRCWFDAYSEGTFLKYLIDESSYIDKFIELLIEWKSCTADLAKYEVNTPTDPDEVEFYESVKEDCDIYWQDLQDIYNDYKEYFARVSKWIITEPETWEQCIAAVEAWKADRDRLKGEEFNE